MSRTTALLIFISIGLVLTFGGLYSATIAPVTCHDKPMKSGDVCKTYNRPSRTYDEESTTQRVVGWVMFGLGPTVIVWAVVRATRGNRRSAAPPHHPPLGPPAPGAGPYPPQPRSQANYPPPYYPPPGSPPPGARGYYPPQYPPPNYPPPNYPPPGPYRPPPSGR